MLGAPGTADEEASGELRIEKMLASYASTADGASSRREYGRLMSMWARQIHFPFRRPHSERRCAGWGHG